MNTKERGKIFVLSRQRCGTTSTGAFLEAGGIKTCRESRLTSQIWALQNLVGEHSAIFNHPKFIENTAFEDNPWWRKGMYRHLAQLPDAKFILLWRDPDQWFDSMRAFNNGYIFELPILHLTEYDRTEEYFDYFTLNRLISKNQFNFRIEEHHRKKYTTIFEQRHNEIIDFFSEMNLSSSLFQGSLESPTVWDEMADFIGIPSELRAPHHLNRSGKQFYQQEPTLVQKVNALLHLSLDFLNLRKRPIEWVRCGEEYIVKEQDEST